jgi:NAD-dependent dihydropyrimidine dehydrogenase PreA subunit
MINITNKIDCCGCTACYNICPQRCIEMIEDKEGFLYPKVNEERCINCHLCEKVCPILNKPLKTSDFDEKGYVINSKNSEIRQKSPSGGFVSVLSEYVIDNEGVVYGAAYDENNIVKHIRIEDKENISSILGSKYVRSCLTDIFADVKADLQSNKLVCFVGTPCEVNGLHNFLGKKTEKLILVDFVCHGNPSPLIWKKYLEYQEKIYSSKIIECNFRNKTYGYHHSTMKLVFANGKRYYGSARIDYMLKPFLEEISSRPSCYNCSFRDVKRISDFTLFDCWHYEELSGEKDDDKGHTNVVINSNKGVIYFDRLKNIYNYKKINIQKAIKFDGLLYNNNMIINPNRDAFFTDLNQRSLSEAINKFIPITIKAKLFEKVKNILFFAKKRK